MNCRFELDPMGDATADGVRMICQVCDKPYRSFIAPERVRRTCRGTHEEWERRVVARVSAWCDEHGQAPGIRVRAMEAARRCAACANCTGLGCTLASSCKDTLGRWIRELVAASVAPIDRITENSYIAPGSTKP